MGRSRRCKATNLRQADANRIRSCDSGNKYLAPVRDFGGRMCDYGSQFRERAMRGKTMLITGLLVMLVGFVLMAYTYKEKTTAKGAAAAAGAGAVDKAENAVKNFYEDFPWNSPWGIASSSTAVVGAVWTVWGAIRMRA